MQKNNVKLTPLMPFDGEACNVLFGRSKREAANDNDYQSFLERSAA